jgi:hypothetical protein
MRHKKTKIFLSVIIVLALALIGARVYLPYWVTDYVNKEINKLDGYSGSVADVDIHLWRGAYAIHDLDIRKTGSGIPVPFVAVKTIDLSLQWRALFEGAVVAEIDLYNADLNFAIGSNGQTQGTEDAGWARLVDALSPLEINRFTVNGGKLAFKDFSVASNVDLFVNDINLRVENLKAVHDENMALPSPVTLTGTSIGGGKVNATGRMNILKDTPDFDYDIKLEGAKLTAMNGFARSRAGVDFEAGDLSVYVEAAAKDGAVTGYVKPVARGVEMVDIEEDGDPISIAWQSLVSIFAELFENQTEDQLATRVDIVGNLNNPETDTWSAIVGIFKNTFNAYIRDTDDEVNFSNTSPAAGD